jgi:very-short-patch-repair endonuclease
MVPAGKLGRFSLRTELAEGGVSIVRLNLRLQDRYSAATVTLRRLTRIARALRKNDTWAERLLWQWLRDRRFSSYKFRRQHQFGDFILDFFCLEARVNIELDGGGHGHPEQQARDLARDTNLGGKGIKVLRFWNSRLRREKDSIRETIWRTLQERAPHPLPEYCRPMLPTMIQKTKTLAQAPGDMGVG